VFSFGLVWLGLVWFDFVCIICVCVFIDNGIEVEQGFFLLRTHRNLSTPLRGDKHTAIHSKNGLT
jgi:hypothetical protein